jgi:nucleoside-diphosphate-sugar epimerase
VLIKSDGTPWRPLVHVEDIARAVRAVLTAPRDVVHNQAFNIGRNEENYQVRQVADIVAETVVGAEVVYDGDASPDARDYRVDFTKAATLLPEFQPHWNIRKGIEELLDAYRRHDLTEAEFLGPSFTRLSAISRLIDSGHLSNDLRWIRSPAS